MAEPGWRDLLSGANAARSVTLTGGVALHAINIYVATTILPSVVADIGGLPFYAWNLTLFVIGSIVGAALSARALERLGPRRVYRLALACFALGTLLCAIAPSMPVMLLGRTVQGVGGGMLFALSYALIQQLLPEPLWPRALALVSGMWGIATLVGPAVGGAFADLGIWRAAFWSLLALTLAFGLLADRVIVPGRPRAPGGPAGLPLLQLLLLSGAALAVSAGSLAADVWLNLLGLALAVLLLGALLAAEASARTRLLPRGVFSPTTVLGATYIAAALLGATTTAEVFVPYFMQVLHGLTPLLAGYAAALMAAGWTIGSIVTSGFGGRAAAATIVAGPLLVLAGVVGLAVTMPLGGVDAATIAASAALLLVGLGIGGGWPHLVTRILGAAPAGEQELAASSIGTVQLLAEAFGAALGGLVANRAGLIDPGGAIGAAAAAAWLFRSFTLLPLAAAAVLVIQATHARRPAAPEGAPRAHPG